MRKIIAHKGFDKVFFLIFSGFMLSFSVFIVFLWTFLTAYFSKAKATLVTIDTYGKANLELFMTFILLGFVIICLVYGFKRIFSKENK